MKTFQPFVLVTTNLACCDENGKIEEIQNNREVIPIAYEKWDISCYGYDAILNEIKKHCPHFEDNGFGYKINNIRDICNQYVKDGLDNVISRSMYKFFDSCLRVTGYENNECYVRTKEINN